MSGGEGVVERLRLWGEHGLTNTLSNLVEAADTIEAQAAEIKRLREALKPFAKSGDLLVMAEDKGDFWAYRPAGGDEYGITGRHLLAARAALGETR